jgi:hypothetical protein
LANETLLAITFLQLAFGHQHIEQEQAAALFYIAIGKPQDT